jgi:hypothetical protein
VIESADPIANEEDARVVPSVLPSKEREGLVLLANDSMRARRRPWAIAGVWAWETAVALVVALPAASVVRAAYADHPRGDAPLWAPGGLELVDLLLHEMHGVSAIVSTALACAAFAAVVGLLPMAALMTSITHATRDRRAPGLARVAPSAVRAFRPMLVVLVLTLVIQALVLGATALGAGALESSLTPRLGEARGQQIAAVVFAVGVVLLWGAGIVQDLARAAVVRFRVSGLRAYAAGWTTIRRAPVATYWSWAWRALVAWAPVIVAAYVASRIGGRGGLALASLAALHQLVVVLRVALRASWLASALRLVDASAARQV